MKIYRSALLRFTEDGQAVYDEDGLLAVAPDASGRERFSFPLFFDPDFTARVTPLPQHARIDPDRVAADRSARWDGASVLAPFDGTYGDYLLEKVGKVFPQLRAGVE